MTHGRYDPVTQCKLRAAFDARGQLIALHMRIPQQIQAQVAGLMRRTLALACLALAACAAHAQALDGVGDAIAQSLTGTAGDAARGRAIVASRQAGLCLLCHPGPFPEERFQGNLAPDLSGAGARWSAGQLRLRIADARLLNPQTIMPAYHRSDGLQRVGPAWRGKTLLNAQQIEDVVAYLLTLK